MTFPFPSFPESLSDDVVLESLSSSPPISSIPVEYEPFADELRLGVGEISVRALGDMIGDLMAEGPRPLMLGRLRNALPGTLSEPAEPLRSVVMPSSVVAADSGLEGWLWRLLLGGCGKAPMLMVLRSVLCGGGPGLGVWEPWCWGMVEAELACLLCGLMGSDDEAARAAGDGGGRVYAVEGRRSGLDGSLRAGAARRVLGTGRAGSGPVGGFMGRGRVVVVVVAMVGGKNAGGAITARGLAPICGDAVVLRSRNPVRRALRPWAAVRGGRGWINGLQGPGAGVEGCGGRRRVVKWFVRPFVGVETRSP